MTIRQVEAMDQDPGPAPAVPTPTTLTEMVSGAVAIAGLHKGAAEIAMAERNTAEQRADRATADADKRAEAARTEERGQGNMLLQIMKEFTQQSQAAMKSAHEVQMALQKQVHDANVQAVNTKVDVLVQQFQQVTAQKDQEIERLRSQTDSLAKKEGVDEWLTRVLVQGKADDPVLGLLSRLIAPAQNPADDPNRIFQTGLAHVEVEKAKKQLAVEDQKLRHAEESHQQMRGVIAGVTDLLHSPPEWLTGLVTAAMTARGGDRNGVPSNFGPTYNAGGVL